MDLCIIHLIFERNPWLVGLVLFLDFTLRLTRKKYIFDFVGKFLADKIKEVNFNEIGLFSYYGMRTGFHLDFSTQEQI